MSGTACQCITKFGPFRELERTWQISGAGRTLANDFRFVAGVSPILPNLGRHWPNSCPKWKTLDKHWPHSSKTGPAMVKTGPSLANIGPHLTSTDHIRVNSAGGHVRRELMHAAPSRVKGMALAVPSLPGEDRPNKPGTARTNFCGGRGAGSTASCENPSSVGPTGPNLRKSYRTSNAHCLVVAT